MRRMCLAMCGKNSRLSFCERSGAISLPSRTSRGVTSSPIFAMRALKPSIANTSKSRRRKPSAAIRQTRESLRRACGLAILEGLLPVAAVEVVEFELADVHPFEASDVHVEAFGIGARNVERCDAAVGAEQMLCDFRVEGIGRDVVGRGQQTERAAIDDPMKVSLLGADGAVAFGDAIEVAPDLETDAPAMASAAIGSICGRFFFRRRLLVGFFFLHQR